MIRKLKSLGVAVVAALAISSVVASLASADTITAEKFPVTITGSQVGTNIFKVTSGEVKCTTAKYTGTLAAAGRTLTVTPAYSGCTFQGLASTVDMNECDYLIHVNIAAGNTTGTVDVVCPAGKEITVTAPSIGTPKCILHVPPQTDLEGGQGTNLGSGTTREIQIDLDLEKIKYSQTKGTAETGNCVTDDNQEDGTFSGNVLATGEEDPGSGHIGIFLS